MKPRHYRRDKQFSRIVCWCWTEFDLRLALMGISSREGTQFFEERAKYTHFAKDYKIIL